METELLCRLQLPHGKDNYAHHTHDLNDKPNTAIQYKSNQTLEMKAA